LIVLWSLASMIDYEETRLFALLFRWEGSVGIKSFLFPMFSALLAASILLMRRHVDGFWEHSGIEAISGSQTWQATTGMLVVLMAFRTRQALARFWEGTSLLHQMRGEWFDSVSCCVTFSRSALETKPDDVWVFRHTIVRLMSLCHGSALQEIADADFGTIPTVDVFGLDAATLQYLRDCKQIYCFNRVEVILHLIQTLITRNQAAEVGVLQIPPPILSRVYQTLSRGFVNHLNAKKIVDTRFPFPYAQIIGMLLIINSVLTPVMMAQLVPEPVWAAVFSFVPVFGAFSLNFVAIELENPFGNDPNDLPLVKFQREMNNSLLMLLHGKSDLVAGLSRGCITDFDELASASLPSSDGRDTARLSHNQLSQGSLRFSEKEQDVLVPSSQILAPVSKVSVAAMSDAGTASVAETEEEDDEEQDKEAENPQEQLLQGIQDFGTALRCLTQTVEQHTGELDQSFDALRQISDSVPVLLEVLKPDTCRKPHKGGSSRLRSPGSG